MTADPIGAAASLLLASDFQALADNARGLAAAYDGLAVDDIEERVMADLLAGWHRGRARAFMEAAAVCEAAEEAAFRAQIEATP
jgi:hypothetical protein